MAYSNRNMCKLGEVCRNAGWMMSSINRLIARVNWIMTVMFVSFQDMCISKQIVLFRSEIAITDMQLKHGAMLSVSM